MTSSSPTPGPQREPEAPFSVRAIVLVALAGGVAYLTWRNPPLGLAVSTGIASLLVLHTLTK